MKASIGWSDGSPEPRCHQGLQTTTIIRGWALRSSHSIIERSLPDPLDENIDLSLSEPLLGHLQIGVTMFDRANQEALFGLLRNEGRTPFSAGCPTALPIEGQTILHLPRCMRVHS